MKELVPKLKNGTKTRTCRACTEYRLKCEKGDIMHIFTGLRTKKARKIFDAVLIQRFIWSNYDIPETKEKAKETYVVQHFEHLKDPQPVYIQGKKENWLEFAYRDGFENYEDFKEYFLNHPKDIDTFICYIFKKQSKITNFFEK
jgi:hypothetical protein